MYLLGRIERYLRRHSLSATRFGREAMGDPQFVQDLRRGREPRPETVARIAAFLERDRNELADGSCAE